MSDLKIRQAEPVNDALSLEYKLQYGCATGNLRLSDVVNDPTRLGKVRVFGHKASRKNPSISSVSMLVLSMMTCEIFF